VKPREEPEAVAFAADGEEAVEDFDGIEWLNDDLTIHSLLRLLRAQCDCFSLPHALALALCVHTICPPVEQSGSNDHGKMGADLDVEENALDDCEEGDDSTTSRYMPDALREEGALDCLVDNVSWSLASDAGRGQVIAWMSLAILEEALYKNAENKVSAAMENVVDCGLHSFVFARFCPGIFVQNTTCTLPERILQPKPHDLVHCHQHAVVEAREGRLQAILYRTPDPYSARPGRVRGGRPDDCEPNKFPRRRRGPCCGLAALPHADPDVDGVLVHVEYAQDEGR
jgi:hypothetical protein